jgi:hypothetical protein
MRMLDLFCGRWGWSKAFAERGWECVGVDLVEPPEIPDGCRFHNWDVMNLTVESVKHYDFVCASSPCEQFSVHGMRHFHPNPKYPDLGIKLFNHTRSLCEASGVPYVMENVRAAQQFVGNAVNHCGPFYLWGNGVPPLMPQGISKGMTRKAWGAREFKGQDGWNRKHEAPRESNSYWSNSKGRRDAVAANATIPPLLAAAVADYATRLYEARVA